MLISLVLDGQRAIYWEVAFLITASKIVNNSPAIFKSCLKFTSGPNNTNFRFVVVTSSVKNWVCNLKVLYCRDFWSNFRHLKNLSRYYALFLLIFKNHATTLTFYFYFWEDQLFLVTHRYSFTTSLHYLLMITYLSNKLLKPKCVSWVKMSCN